MEVQSMAKNLPRMMDARFSFQTNPDAEGDFVQFFIRLFLRDGRLVSAYDLYAENGNVEGLEPETLEAMKAALELVKGRVKKQELHEQKE